MSGKTAPWRITRPGAILFIVSPPFSPKGASDSNDLVQERQHEESLVARVRDGDTSAFAILVREYLEPVTRFARHLAGSWDTAEDLVQYVFVQIWQSRATLDPARPFKPYLYRAVRNRALDEQKANRVRQRHRTVVQSEAEDGPASAIVGSPEEDILFDTDLAAALRQLPERRALAIRLRYEAQMTHAEIGEILGVSSPAAMQLVLRGLEQLRQILKA